MALRIKGNSPGHLITHREDEPSLRANKQQALSIMEWLVIHCNAHTIYFLWDEMKIANERYLLQENVDRLQRRLEEEEREPDVE